MMKNAKKWNKIDLIINLFMIAIAIIGIPNVFLGLLMLIPIGIYQILSSIINGILFYDIFKKYLLLYWAIAIPTLIGFVVFERFELLILASCIAMVYTYMIYQLKTLLQ